MLDYLPSLVQEKIDFYVFKDKLAQVNREFMSMYDLHFGGYFDEILFSDQANVSQNYDEIYWECR
jgi:hypothetical protein